MRAVIARRARVLVRSKSVVSRTGPIDEFSIGTTPKVVSSDKTEVKTSARVA